MTYGDALHRFSTGVTCDEDAMDHYVPACRMSGRRTVAIHEAAHAALAWVLMGERTIVGGASIRADLATDGHAEVLPSFAPGELFEAQRLTLLGEPIDAAFRTRIEHAAMVLMAGMVAELDAAERSEIPELVPPEPGSSEARAIEARIAEARQAATEAGEELPEGDHERIGALIDAIALHPEERAAYRTVLLARVRRHLNGYRRLVAAVSTALEERETLSRSELIDAIRNATGTHPPKWSDEVAGEWQPERGSHEWRVRELQRMGLPPYGSEDVQ